MEKSMQDPWFLLVRSLPADVTRASPSLVCVLIGAAGRIWQAYVSLPSAALKEQWLTMLRTSLSDFDAAGLRATIRAWTDSTATIGICS